MIRGNRSTRTQTGSPKPDGRPGAKKKFRKGKEYGNRTEDRVAGIRAGSRFKDDEEKLLNRRPRVKVTDRNTESTQRPLRKTSGQNREFTPGRRARSTDGPGGQTNRPLRRTSGQNREFTPTRRVRNTEGSVEQTKRPSRWPAADENSNSRFDRKQEKSSRPGSKPVEDKNRGKRGDTYIKPDRRRRSLPNRTEKLEPYSEEMRLNRFIANSGVCSRREADRYIETGLVTINGKIVTELGTKVTPSDEVRFDGKKLIPEKKVYLLLNKPKNFVTTTDDPHSEKTVMDLITDACPERVYPVGRLDKNTTGLLLFTNDGELSKRLTHPSFNNKKIYQATLDKPVTKQDLQQIADGVELEDGVIAADNISYIDPERKAEIGIEIHSGRNRVVRRIFEHLGYNVVKLDRVLYAGLTKKNLPRGKWRFLSPKEVGFLKMN